MAALVERIPRDGIQKGKSVHQTQMDLGSELGLGPGLSSDDGTCMGLIDTHYPAPPDGFLLQTSPVACAYSV
jgi:hypothetical protein